MHAYHQLYQCKIVGGVHMGVMSLKFNSPTSQVSVIGGVPHPQNPWEIPTSAPYEIANQFKANNADIFSQSLNTIFFCGY